MPHSPQPNYVKIPFNELTEQQRRDAYERETFDWVDRHDYSDAANDVTYAINELMVTEWELDSPTLTIESWDVNPLSVAISGELTPDNSPTLFADKAMRGIDEIRLEPLTHYRVPNTNIVLELSDEYDDRLWRESGDWDEYMSRTGELLNYVESKLDELFSVASNTLSSAHDYLFSYERWADIAESNGWEFDVYM